MRVVRFLELIFNPDSVSIGRVLCKNIRTERSDVFFLRLQFEIETDVFAQQSQVFVLGEPRREISRLGFPDLPKFDGC